MADALRCTSRHSRGKQTASTPQAGIRGASKLPAHQPQAGIRGKQTASTPTTTRHSRQANCQHITTRHSRGKQTASTPQAGNRRASKLPAHHVRCADLLRDPARLAILHVGAPDVVQKLRLARVDVAQDRTDGRPQPFHRPLLFRKSMPLLDPGLHFLQ